MSARLTPRSVADRELERLARKEAKLMAELQEIHIERERWSAVLRALDPPHDGAYDDEGSE